MNQRMRTFEHVKATIKSPTPLLDLGSLGLSIPNGCRILAKAEYDRDFHPTGSHYDRVFVPLIEDCEKNGVPTSTRRLDPITPDHTHLLEVSSGNAGAAFAYAATALGYACSVIIPSSSPRVSIPEVSRQPPHISFRLHIDLVDGNLDSANQRLLELLSWKRDALSRRFISVNHSSNPLSPKLMAEIVSEAFAQFGNLDYFVAGIGNGSSLLGTSTLFHSFSPKGKIIVWEPFSSAPTYDKLFGLGAYEGLWGMKTGFFDHDLVGTGVNSQILFPFVEEFVRRFRALINLGLSRLDYSFVTDEKQYEAYLSKGGGANRSELPDWRKVQKELHSMGLMVGRTAAASVSVAIDYIVKHSIANKNFLVIFYDGVEKHR